MKRISTLFLLVFLLTSIYAQPFLNSPISGNEIDDYTIVNYVDWEFSGILDHECGNKTYDGHQGTDYSLKSFVEMDEGIDVLAAAAGEVTFVQDGLFDRETISDPSKGLGNYIAIRHSNDYYSYYGHLKKNSILVTVGQTVAAGEVIGQVGSSGNSTDPHLHFELWYHSVQLVDPFQGACGNPEALWLDGFNYETDFRIWESGMADYILEIDSLRERAGLKGCCPFMMDQTSTNPTLYWAQMIGLLEGDVLTIQWFTPDNQLWFEFDFDINQDWWYYYFWSFIDPGDLPEGLWNVKLLLNGEEKDNLEFLVEEPNAINSLSEQECARLAPEQIEKIESIDFMGRSFNPVFDQQSTELITPFIEKVFLVNGAVCMRKKIIIPN